MIQKLFRCCVVFPLTVYQYFLSPDSGVIRYLGFSKGGVCRFQPSCSEYTKRMVLSHGITKGVLLGTQQLLRCHPFGKR